MAHQIPRATMQWMEGAGRLGPIERPDDFTRALVPFVSAQLAG